jgi:DNA topoisomerase-1
MKNVKRQEVPTDIDCENCKKKMVIKFGRHGEFLACPDYPDCKTTKEFKRNDKGEVMVLEDPVTEEKCEKCGSDMLIKRGKFGEFLACSKYPDCKNTKAIPIGVDCPKCKKPLAQRTTRRGKLFYGCTGYPTCDFASWDKPVPEKCPQCESPYLIEKYTKAKDLHLKCPEKECNFEKPIEE